jgi:hypothetical protein
VFVVANLDIPELGDATSPLYVMVEDPLEAGSGWAVASVWVESGRADIVDCDEFHSSPPFSTILGSNVGLEQLFPRASYVNPGVPQVFSKTTTPAVFPAGDQVEVHLAISIDLRLGATLGSFDDTIRIGVFSLTPAIGNGDLNGDRAVDIVDSTLLRQNLAGFPSE